MTNMQAVLQMRRQLRYWLEISGWERSLVYVDASLSLLGVIIYILSTYRCGWLASPSPPAPPLP
jgi:hypothetical protein